MADLDHFKQINDSHGHLIGDAVLHETGRRLQSAVRSYDAVGRYGGEEFLIIVPDCDKRCLVASAERLRHAVGDSPIRIGDGETSVTASLGLASFSVKDGLTDCESLIQAADLALYAAKANGRNRIELAGAATGHPQTR